MPATAERTVPARHAPTPTDAPDPRLFRDNLRAIAKRQAELADLLAAADISECVRFFRGRDGSATARVRDGDGGWHWLAHSSAPAVSAPELVGRFSMEPMNLALLGPGSGRELLELAGRLHYHQAIFCLLDDGPGIDGVSAAAAVLRLVDLSAVLASGRVVLATGDGPASLSEFLRRHDGFAPPGQVLPWPWQSPDRFTAITARVGAICERRVGEVAEAAERVARRFGEIESHRPTRPSGVHRVMGIAPAAQSANRLAIEGLLAAAASDRQCDTRLFLIDGPDGAAPIAQSAALADFDPDLLVMIDRTRADLTPAPPRDCRVATWVIDENATVLRRPGRLPAAGGASDLLLASSRAIESALRRVGFAASQIVALPPGTDGRVFAPSADPEFDCDALLVGDVGAVDAEAMGIEWPSHRRLWDECLSQVRRDPGGYGPEFVDRFLARAERSAGLAVRDAELRERFIEALRRTGGPTTLRLCAARAIESCGCEFRLAGAGWAECGFDASRVVARPADWVGWRRLFHSARLVVFMPDADQPPQAIPDAAACGAAILVRVGPESDGPEEGPDPFFGIGRMFALGRELATFATPGDLPRLIRRYLSRPHDRAALADAARRRVERDHLYSHRLATILHAAGLPDDRASPLQGDGARSRPFDGAGC